MTRRRRHLRALIAIALGLAAGGGVAQAAAAPAAVGAVIIGSRCAVTATGTWALAPRIPGAASIAIIESRPGRLFGSTVAENARQVGRGTRGSITVRFRIPRGTPTATTYYASMVMNYRTATGRVRTVKATSRAIRVRCV